MPSQPTDVETTAFDIDMPSSTFNLVPPPMRSGTTNTALLYT